MRFLKALAGLGLLMCGTQVAHAQSPTLQSVILSGSTSGTATLQAPAVAGANTATLPAQTGIVGLVMTATSTSLGGSALAAGACSSTTVTATGAATGMGVVATPAADPGVGTYWQAFVSAANTVTVRVCATISVTPTAETYAIRVTQ